MSRQLVLYGLFLLTSYVCSEAAEPVEIVDLWPNGPPGPTRELGPEQDFTKPDDRLIAGRPIIKLGNVATPQAHVYLAPSKTRTNAAVVVCPGGGFSILAWDLEGTEVAEWLNSLHVNAIVLKYRVPTRDQDPRWMAPVQDTQRTISLVRHRAAEWKLDRDKIGILGFSAGAATAARTALASKRYYEPVDAADQLSSAPNLAMLIYPGALLNDSNRALQDNLLVTEKAPPMFFIHAFDDRVRVENSVLLFQALKQAGVPSELHAYDAGGHGYGLRQVDNLPVTTWPSRCEDWLRRQRWVNSG